MKKLFLLLLVVVSLGANAQYVVNYASNIDQNETDGFFYNLPRNVIRLDFVVECVHEMKGKYSAYAEELLGADGYIKENSKRYYIKDVVVNVMAEADDEMTFYISTDEKNRGNMEFDMSFSSGGNLQSLGFRYERRGVFSGNIYSENKINQQEVGADFADSDSDSDFIYLPLRDDDEEELSSDDKMSEKDVAQSVVDEIKKIRVAYLDLISGYQEVNYGNTMTVMLDELKKMENNYLALFVGKVEKRDFVKTFYIIPEEGTDNYSVAKFSDKEGFNSKTGDNVKVVLQNLSSSNVKKVDADAVKNTTYNNKMVYREPAYVNMKLMKGDEMLSDTRMQINQLGDFVLLPINKMKLEFDEVSGRLISVEKK